MNLVYEKLKDCVRVVQKKVKFKPEVALVLGSGLGDYASEMKVEQTLSYSEIEGFPISTVPGHQGRFLFGTVRGVPVVIMQGRVHYYEGYEMSDVVLPIRLMGMLGARVLILTNAAGGINKSMSPGDLMMITDHISSFIPNPLTGSNLEELGPRFPDMSEIYDKNLRNLILKASEDTGVPIRQGVYVQSRGPAYETPSEIKMYGRLGIDAAGMSTVCEAIAANHMGMKVCGISCITNMAAGITDQRLNHKEVQETADRVSHDFQTLVTETIELIGGCV